jgi:poly-gamma-glutamate synthesis protein (capsule biosynthesis protein)
LIANLEAPFLDPSQGFPARAKAGPHLWTNCLPVADCGFVFALANNHIMDYGLEGLRATTSQLRSRGFHWLGAGENSLEAEKPLILDCGGIRYGILARCEAQFGRATLRRPGVAVLDATINSAISRLKAEADFVIVSVHAASEMCPWPSPKRQHLYRTFINAGADVVHGHHAHVPQAYEYYNGGIIFYGMGNLCVDPAIWSEHPNALWSIIAEISRTNSNLAARITTVSIRQYDRGIVVEASQDMQVQQHLLYLQNCSRPLADPDLLTGLWQENAMRMYELYYADWLGFRKRDNLPDIKAQFRQMVKTMLSRIRRAPAKPKGNPSQYSLLLWHVLFACESHSEAISAALGLLSGELEDLRNHETRLLADEMMPWSRGVISG